MNSRTETATAISVAAAAAAITAAALLTAPAPARAYPMVPLAPACDSFKFNGVQVIDALGDTTYTFGETGDTTVGGDGSITQGGKTIPATVSGSGITGSTLDVSFDDGHGGGPTLIGQINDDGSASGGGFWGPDPDGGVDWRTRYPDRIRCTHQAAGPAPAPNQPAQQGPARASAQVNGDVDVYDNPGGNGTIRGILRKFDTVTLVSCGDDNWCHVSGRAVPTGDGWVWGDFLDK